MIIYFYISPNTITYNISIILNTDIYDNDINLFHILIYGIINNINNINNIIPIYNQLCAGVFLVKNNKDGKNIINEWLSKYNSQNWRYNNNSWHTDGFFAGIEYEQGVFNTYIYPQFKKSIKVLHSSALSDINYKHPNSYVSHYMGTRKKFINQIPNL